MIKDLEGQQKWDLRFMELTKMVASWSKDPSTKVGAVIADNQNRIISLGYNGFAKGIDDTEDRYADRSFKYSAIIHAEENAMFFANRDLSGCTIYVSFFPCSNCAAKIIQCGIKRVVTTHPTEEQIGRWGKSFNVSKILLEEASIQICYY